MNHDLIPGQHREEIVRELTLSLISDAERHDPREFLDAMARASGMIIGASYSPLMHDGVFAAIFDMMSAWSKTTSK